MSKYKFNKIRNCPLCQSNEINVIGKRLNGYQGLSPHKKAGVTVSIMKCQNCNLVFANPIPIPENLADHYGVPPEQYWKPEYFKVEPDYMKGQLDWLEQLNPYEKGMNALDIGAGLGKAMIALEKRGYTSYGIEPSEPFFHRAIDKMGVSEQNLLLTKIEDARFEPNSFDVIFFSAVLEHLYNPSEILKKVVDWLKPNGLLYIQVPSSNWLMSRLLNTFYRIRGLDYVTNLSPMHEPYHLFEFTVKSFEINSQINNYKIVDYKYFVCDTFLPSYIDPIIKPIMKYTKTGMELGIWLKKEN